MLDSVWATGNRSRPISSLERFRLRSHIPFNETGATLVSEVYNFTSRPADCDRCRDPEQECTLATGCVTLINSLITRWKSQVQQEPERDAVQGTRVLESMEPADVVNFLTGNLH